MRKADIDAGWRKCRQDRSALRINFVIADDANTGVQIEIESRVTGFVGPNGAGKTRLLSGLRSLAQGDEIQSSDAIRLVSGEFRGQPFQLPATGGSKAPPIFYLDVSRDVHAAKTLLESQANLDELIDQFGARTVNGDELDRYRHVCRKNYESLRIREVEPPTRDDPGRDSEESDEEVIPFFEVVCDGVSYDSRTMGFGELCACHTIWWVNRLTSSSILVMDEPDAHLSPSSRCKLLDVIALAASESRHAVFLSSHSAELLDQLAESETLVVLPDRDTSSRSRVSRSATKRHALRGLGLSRAARILVAVEDIDAQEAVRQMLNTWGQGLARYFDIQIVEGGATEVARFIRLFPKNSKSFRAFGILDGDKRDAFQHEDDLLFLPGTRDPIADARTKVSERLASFSDTIGVDTARVTDALREIEHVNHHDFIAAFGESLGISATSDKIRTSVISNWLGDVSISADAKATAEQLLERLAQLPLD